LEKSKGDESVNSNTENSSQLQRTDEKLIPKTSGSSVNEKQPDNVLLSSS